MLLILLGEKFLNQNSKLRKGCDKFHVFLCYASYGICSNPNANDLEKNHAEYLKVWG